VDPADTASDQLGKWLGYLNLARRHRGALILTSLCGALLALVVSVLQTPVYGAFTTLEFQGAQAQPFEGISFLNQSNQSSPLLLQTQVELLGSRRLQDRVSARLVETPRDDGPLAPTFVNSIRRRLGLIAPPDAAEWEKAVSRARGALTIVPVKETPIVQIATQSTMARAAADYVNTVAEVFIEFSREERWSLYQNTGAMLERAQEELRTKLEDSEKQLLEYANGTGLVVTSGDANIAEQKLRELQAEVTKAESERIAKEARYRTALAVAPDALEQAESGLMAGYESRLTELRRELAEATTSLTEAHPKVKALQAQIEVLSESRTRERSNMIGRMRTEYEAALERERQLIAGLGAQSQVVAEQDRKLIRYKTLQREVETYRKIHETTLQTGKEASLASALGPVNARLIDSARPAGAPSRPNLTQNLTFGLIGGLLLGFVLVWIRERTDGSIREPGAMQLHTNLRELGVIPSAKAEAQLPVAAPGRRHQLSAVPSGAPANLPGMTVPPVELAMWDRKGSRVAESFRATLTSILLSGQEGFDNHVILVTSPSPREGKSTVATNLAIALAEIHQRVLLVDADLRRPRLHTIFGQANTWGLSDILRDETPCADYPAEALGRRTHVPGLFSLPSGPNSHDGLRLLYSTRMTDLVNRLRQDFDAVLIDTPPVLSVADARVLSRLVDVIVLVVRAGLTTRESAAAAVKVLEADGVPVLGTVLNDWTPNRADDDYGSGYGYYDPGATGT
jgi:capsular exopolysaccharide synthesis family protein